MGNSRGRLPLHLEENDLLHLEGKLRCRKCNRIKGTHLYFKEKGRRWGHNYMCKACFKKHRHVDTNHKSAMKTKFGITLDEYDQMLQAQDGRCYICRKKPRKRRLAVDHDHFREQTEGIRRSIRGLLCNPCNRYLGHLSDDPQAILRAYKYLVDPPARLQ